MASRNKNVPIVVYYDAYVVDCDESVEFKGGKNVLVSMRRGMTFNVLKTKIQHKMSLNQGQTITTVIYRYLISAGFGMFNYQAVTISDDEDIDGMFDVYNRHQCLSSFQLLVRYEQQPSSTANAKTTVQSPQIHKTPYTGYHTQTFHEGPSSCTPIPYTTTNDYYVPHFEPTEFNTHITSYTQLLGASSNYYETTPQLNEPSQQNADPTTDVHVASLKATKRHMTIILKMGYQMK